MRHDVPTLVSRDLCRPRGLVRGRNKLREQPLLLFFLVSYLVAMLFMAGWGLHWGGLPEFSALGFID